MQHFSLALMKGNLYKPVISASDHLKSSAARIRGLLKLLISGKIRHSVILVQMSSFKKSKVNAWKNLILQIKNEPVLGVYLKAGLFDQHRYFCLSMLEYLF